MYDASGNSFSAPRCKGNEPQRWLMRRRMQQRAAQPSGAATPRNSDTHKRIAVPKAFCVLWEHPRPRPPKGKVRSSDTRPGEVCERAERSESSDTTPSEMPLFRRVCPCVRSCWRKALIMISLACKNVKMLTKKVETSFLRSQPFLS